MDGQCGLVNPANPCRCRLKTQAFIRAGWVDPNKLQFTRPTLRRLGEVARRNVAAVDSLLEKDFADLYRRHPFYDAPPLAEQVTALINNNNFQKMFFLDE